MAELNRLAAADRVRFSEFVIMPENQGTPYEFPNFLNKILNLGTPYGFYRYWLDILNWMR